MPTYTIHIEFTDGSNPYTRFNMNLSEYLDEKAKWEKNYVLVPDMLAGSIVFFTAYEKEK